MRMSCANPACPRLLPAYRRCWVWRAEHPHQPAKTKRRHPMPFYVVVRPGVGDEVRVVEDSPEGPQLVADLGGAYLSLQVDRADPGGSELAAGFARQVAGAAM